jgi:hypothetical protein
MKNLRDLEHYTRLYTCKKNIRENAVIKKECENWLPHPARLKRGWYTFAIEPQITSPSMNMDLCFNDLLWSGGLLPYESGGNITRRENTYFFAFWSFLIFILFLEGEELAHKWWNHESRKGRFIYLSTMCVHIDETIIVHLHKASYRRFGILIIMEFYIS